MDNVAVLPSREGADLIGRAAAFSVLDAFLDRASSDGAAQLLTGGPGVGKTALLDAACHLAAARSDPRTRRPQRRSAPGAVRQSRHNRSHIRARRARCGRTAIRGRRFHLP